LRIVSAVPREDRPPSLDPNSLFNRIVHRKLGGYCFFHSLNTCNVLLGLAELSKQRQVSRPGWRIISVIPISGVVCIGKTPAGEPKYEGEKGATHCICLVKTRREGPSAAKEAEEREFVVDVGFGRMGPVVPVPLPDHSKSTGSSETEGKMAYDSDFLPNEAWRIRNPTETEIPGILKERNGKVLIMEHRLVSSASDGKKESEWELLYAFSTAVQEDLSTFQYLSDRVFEGTEGYTQKFKSHLTISRIYRVNKKDGDLSFDRSAGETYEDETPRYARLALTDMELSTFDVTPEGKGNKNVVEAYQSEGDRRAGIEKVFGLDVQ
jgi:hypothetical protein